MSLIENLCGITMQEGPEKGRLFLYPEQPFPMPIELNSVGYHYITSHEYSWQGDNRQGKNSALLQYTVSGRGALEFEDRTWSAAPGSMMLLLLPEHHRYFLPADSAFWEVRFVNFGGTAAAEFISSLRRRFGAVAALHEEGETARRLARLIEEPAPPTAWEAANAAMALLTGVGRELEQHDARCPRPAFITTALDYCRSHMSEPFSVEELSRRCGMSRWYFSREFRRILNMTVPQYMLKLRMGAALELLRNSDLSVKEIAARCGFENPAYFIRCFRNSEGVTPGEYREKL